MRRCFLFCLALMLLAGTTVAQEPADEQPDPIYDRPFVASFGSGTTAVGGYIEGNTNYFSEDGVTEGFSMELRRFNIFLYSSIGSRISFFSELEFEHGTEEIALETALIDFALHPAFVLRGGILLPPIGMFNQNHDSPKWEFIERPLVSTQIIPSTLSEVGFGIHGRFYTPVLALGYEAYLVNGLGDGILANGENRTFLPAGRHEELFAEDNNGVPAFTARLGLEKPGWGEMGLSYYGGVYNRFRMEGNEVDARRTVALYALDLSTTLPVTNTTLQGELALARIDVPEALSEVFGERQRGGFVELIQPVLTATLFGRDPAVWNLNLRAEHVDFNVDTFDATGRSIGDEVWALVLGTSFRPTSETVFKANYRYHWIDDLLGNPVRLAGIQVGFATYF